MTEVAPAPIRVWAAFAEVPGAYTLAGGAICVEAMLRMRHADRPRPRGWQAAPFMGGERCESGAHAQSSTDARPGPAAEPAQHAPKS